MSIILDHIAENERKWDKLAGSWEKGRYSVFRFFQRKAAERLAGKPGMTFLDIGCGTGWAVRHISRLAEGKGEFWGVDISGRMIEEARLCSSGNGNLNFLKADASELPFRDDYFDNILCTNSFHHYPDPERVIREMERVLKPAGRICILDLTPDDILTRALNRIFMKAEKAHVSFYPTPAYREMFSGSRLLHVCSKTVIYPMKLHIAVKR